MTIRWPALNRCRVSTRWSPVDALVCARRLAMYRVGAPPAQDGGSLGDVAAFDPITLWRSQDHHDRLCVPIGATADGAPLELDIKEAAENGMGPHGLCVGATGSGKSELLRTIALGMMARNSPEVLNLLLVDFKGGATFLDLARAPHVAAVITNLSDEAPLVARMRDALAGEMDRRQRLLRAARLCQRRGVRTRASGRQQLTALPTLFIIVDEFSELLSQHPDFADMFVAIGRLGRSLGMHLLLASQRLDEGRLRGLEAHLSYRICLKTLSAGESRAVLGTLDAYELPNTPGAGFLRSSNGELIRFQAAFVSGPLQAGRPARVRTGDASGAGCSAPGPSAPVAARRRGERRPPAPSCKRSWGGCPDTDRRAHQVWLPPLGRHRRWTPCSAMPIRRRRPDGTHRRRRPAVRAVPHAADGRLVRRRGQCGGRRRTPIGQVDGAADADHGVGGHARSGAGAVLLPGLRRRSAGVAARRCRTWVPSPAEPSRSWSARMVAEMRISRADPGRRLRADATRRRGPVR